MLSKLAIFAFSLLLSFNVTAQDIAQNRSANLYEKTSGIDGLTITFEGPNCWNGALIHAGILKTPRATTKPEFWHWMNSKYCKAKSPHENPEKGDIGSLFWNELGNYHSFIYLDQIKVFSKNGPKPKDSYKIQYYEDMFYPEFKQMASQCKGSEADLHYNPQCKMKIVYHSCKELPADFYSRHRELKEIDDALIDIESLVLDWSKSSDKKLIPQLEKSIISLTKFFKDLKSRRYNGDLEFARQSMVYRIMGLALMDSYPVVSADTDAVLEQMFNEQKEQRGHVPSAPGFVLRK